MSDHEEMAVHDGSNIDGCISPGAGQQQNIWGAAEFRPPISVEDSLACKCFLYE